MNHLRQAWGSVIRTHSGAKQAAGQVQIQQGTPLQYPFGGKPFRLYILDAHAEPLRQTYFEQSHLVAFLDGFQQPSDWIMFAYMAVRKDYQGMGLGRQLVEDLYRRFPQAQIDWGKVMSDEAGTLFEFARKRWPDRTRGQDWYSR